MRRGGLGRDEGGTRMDRHGASRKALSAIIDGAMMSWDTLVAA
jgi:hypothetical protein